MKNPIMDEMTLQLTYFPLLNKLLLDEWVLLLFSPREKEKQFTFQNSSLLVKSFPAYIESVRIFEYI